MSKIIINNNLSTELQITHTDNEPAKQLNTGDFKYIRNTVDELASIIPTGAILSDYDGQVCFIKDLDRGGSFIYDSTKVSDSNDGTNFSGWVRQYDGAVNVKWFGAVGDGDYNTGAGTDDAPAIQRALDFAKVQKKDIVLVGNHLIKSTLRVGAYTSISASNKFSSIIPHSSFSGNYLITINVTEDESTWEIPFAGLSSRISSLSFRCNQYTDARCFLIGGTVFFEDVIVRNASQIATKVNQFLDNVGMKRVFGIDGSTHSTLGNLYAIDMNSQGDGLHFDQIQINNYINAFRLRQTLAGSITNSVLNGAVEIVNSNATLDVVYMESDNAKLLLGTGNINISNSTFNVGFRADKFITSDNITTNNLSNISIRDSVFEYRVDIINGQSLSYHYEEVIDFNPNNIIKLENVYARITSSKNVAKNQLLGILSTDQEWNKKSFMLSQKSINSGGTNKANSNYFIESANTNNYFISSISTDVDTKWNEASGTYYYKPILYFDIDRLVGYQLGEFSKTLTNGGGGHIIGLSNNASFNTYVVRIFRGTSSGSYTQFADINVIDAQILWDTGFNISNVIWKTKVNEPIAAIGLGSGLTGIEYKGKNAVMYAYSAPTIGSWERGDEVRNTTTTNGGSYGWSCVSSGAPGTWKPFGIIDNKGADFNLVNLPTADPKVVGQLWNNGGTVTVSAG